MLFLFFCLSLFFSSPEDSVEIEFISPYPNEGQLSVAIFAADAAKAFPSDAVRAHQSFVLQHNTLQLAELPHGKYAVSVFQDLNNNGKLDTNFLGIPTEPYGYSQNPRPRFRAATFEEAAFEYSGKATKIVINLLK